MSRYAKAPRHFVSARNTIKPRQTPHKDIKNIEEYGFDLTTFKSQAAFERTLEENHISKKPSRTQAGYYEWKGDGVTMITALWKYLCGFYTGL